MNDEFLKKAMDWACENQPDSSMSHKAAFCNSVAYLCSGLSGGYGGPSLREHLCSWSLSGEHPLPGNWEFEKAIHFCAPLCFQSAEKYFSVLIEILEREFCFDDAPEDLEILRGK